MAIDKKFTDGYVNMQFDDVKLRWGQLQPHQYDQYSPAGAPPGEKKWVTDLLINDKLGKALKKEGFNVKQDADGYYLNVSKKCEKSDGTPNRPVTIVGRDGKVPITEELGNGTEANVKVSARKWGTVQTITVYIDAVQVLKLVEYNGTSGFSDVGEADAVPF